MPTLTARTLCCHVVGLALLVSAAFARVQLANAEEPESVDVERVADVLKRRCYECHSHTSKTIEAGLALDVASGWLHGGDSGAAVVPHKPDDSLLVRVIRYTDADLKMPPEGKLPAEEISLLESWIRQGAADPNPGAAPQSAADPTDWWAFRALSKPPVPQVRVDHPIDAFVWQKLSERGLLPSPAADRRTLIRRLYLDLIGLPPTPEDVASFVSDSEPLAYERLVDRLLAFPRYGEHWGRHWLDVVHYADTHGNDHDHHRPNAWPYRDYVIRSLNEDKPYAKFIQEQVAADVLFPDDSLQVPALGFLAAGPWDHTLMVVVREDTVDHQMAQVLDRDDMVSTVMSTFQSLTVHCARCHSHKFDPISQREYYGLQAVFAGVDRADRPYGHDAQLAAQRALAEARQRALQQRDEASLRSLDQPAAAEEIDFFKARIAELADDWELLDIVDVRSATDSGATFTRQDDGSWLVGGNRPAQDVFVVTARTKSKNMRALRLETMADVRLPGGGPGRYDSGNFHLTEFRATAAPLAEPTSATWLTFSKAVADHDEQGYGISGAIDGNPTTWWGVHPSYGASHEGVFELQQPIDFADGTELVIRLEHNGKDGHQIGRFRLTMCDESTPAERRAPVAKSLSAALSMPLITKEQRHLAALACLAEERRLEIERYLATLPATSEKLVYAATRDFKADGSFKPSPAPRPIHLLSRGNINKPGELIGPSSLACVADLPGDLSIPNVSDEGQRRAALALWLTDPRNGLTWRSIANRVWHYHFGRGLCDTPNDFGRMGATPSHPELLDWLAAWLREDAQGSLKSLHRLIVTSETYQQAVTENPAATQVDADNHLLWRMNRTRLSAEQYRDSLLQLSGELDLTMGGPPVVQFNHRDKATFAPADGSQPFVDYEGFNPDAPEHRRRSIYRFLFRTAPDPLMDALDSPDGGALTPVRTLSSSAPQALALMNNALLLRLSEKIAGRLQQASDELDQQVAAAFQHILLREPQADEHTAVVSYARKHGLANACHILLNGNEFMYVE